MGDNLLEISLARFLMMHLSLTAVSMSAMQLTQMCFAGAAASEPAPKAAAARPAAAAAAAAAPQAMLAKHAHPLASLGGHQMPTYGKIGGQKGVGTVEAANEASVKRKREDGSKCCFIAADESRCHNPQTSLRQYSSQPSLPSCGQALHALFSIPQHRQCMKRCLPRAGTGGKAKEGNGMTAEEAKAVAAREAARQRVQARTAQGFGLGL